MDTTLTHSSPRALFTTTTTTTTTRWHYVMLLRDWRKKEAKSPSKKETPQSFLSTFGRRSKVLGSPRNLAQSRAHPANGRRLWLQCNGCAGSAPHSGSIGAIDQRLCRGAARPAQVHKSLVTSEKKDARSLVGFFGGFCCCCCCYMLLLSLHES